MEGELRIGDLAAGAGVATSAIRYWERRGLLERPRRRSGRRVYDAAALDRVAVIRAAQRAGFTLGEIRTLVRGFPPRSSAGERWRALIAGKRADVRAQIAALRRMLAVLETLERCECPDLDGCGAALRAASEPARPSRRGVASRRRPAW
jgi:DNA-binding transcriptional MerR regulator